MTRERGAALLIVLMLVAALSVILVGLTENMTRATDRIGSAQARDRAYWALIGAERAGLLVLRAQDEARPDVDLPNERWLSAPYAVPIEQGQLTVAFRDRSACFNLNDLVNDGGEGVLSADPEAIKRFGQYLFSLGGDAGTGEALAAAVADFIDTDDAAEPAGAEDFSYSRGLAPYRTASTYLVDASEARAVRGWTAAVARRLVPLVCARPGNAEFGVINLNTLTIADAPLVHAALDNRVPLAEAERLIEQRPPDGYESVDEIFAAGPLAGLSPPFSPAVRQRFGTGAAYIELYARVTFDTHVYELRSFIEKPAGAGYRVVGRRFGTGDT